MPTIHSEDTVPNAATAAAHSPTRAARLGFSTLLAIVVTVIFWASAFAGIRAALVAYTPGHMALLRYLVASIVLAVYAVLTKMPLPARRDLPMIALLGVTGFTIYNLGLGYGEITVPAATASFLIAAAPVFLALLARLVLGERLRLWGWIGTGLSFVGVAAIALANGGGLQISPPALLVLVAALSTSIYSLGQKPLLKRYSALQLVSYSIWAGTLFLLPFGGRLLSQMRAAPLSATLAIIYLGVFPGALGYVGWSHVLGHMPAARAGSVLYLIPVLALLIAWVWLGEAPALVSVFGGVLVLAGVVLVNQWGKIQPSTNAARINE